MKSHHLWAGLGGAIVACFLIGADHPRRAEEDRLPVASEWRGTMTQRGKNSQSAITPGELNTRLWVTHREGDGFDAELRAWADGVEITFLVRGTLVQATDKSYSLAFQSYAVKGKPNASVYYLGVPYCAKVSAEALKGSWSFEDSDREVALEGDFILKRQTP